MPALGSAPFAVVAAERGALVLATLSAAAEATGLRQGMALADARSICPGLVTRPADAAGEAAFRGALARWAGRFSPLVAEDGADGLLLDVTGCARLFGGEAALATAVVDGAAGLGLTARAGLADTVGVAWAVARHGVGIARRPARGAGDAIDQEARATRSRAARRGMADGPSGPSRGVVMVPPGEGRAALATLPVAALRLPPDTVAALSGLGLRRIEDVALLPRAQLARRLGIEVVRRLDQALGREVEPVSAARPDLRLALRLAASEPLLCAADVTAGLGVLAEALGKRLEAAGLGARRVRATLERAGGGPPAVVEAGFARPVDRGAAIMAVLGLRLAALGTGADSGIDVLRLAAVTVEPRTGSGPVRAPGTGVEAAAITQAESPALADLIGRLGGRLGIEAVVRLHPAESHVPARATTAMAAGFAPPAGPWPRRTAPRPPVLHPPEPVVPEDGARPPLAFRWRGGRHVRAAAFGPERMAPEWWLDDPAWRSGPRLYWQVETATGRRLWLFETQGDEVSGGWFVEGDFG